jgi:hypothetical protein
MTPQPITPEVGKRYVTKDGWTTPPWSDNMDYPLHLLMAEYVEPVGNTDTFRRDLIARIYCEMLDKPFGYVELARMAAERADTLIKAMEGER